MIIRIITTTTTTTTIITTIITTSTTTTTPTTTTTTTTADDDIEKNCKHPGFNPDPNYPRDCTIYYSCRPDPVWDGHWIVTKCNCGPGLAFDPILEVCTWPDTMEECDYMDSKARFFRTLLSNEVNIVDECTARQLY